MKCQGEALPFRKFSVCLFSLLSSRRRSLGEFLPIDGRNEIVILSQTTEVRSCQKSRAGPSFPFPTADQSLEGSSILKPMARLVLDSFHVSKTRISSQKSIGQCFMIEKVSRPGREWENAFPD